MADETTPTTPIMPEQPSAAEPPAAPPAAAPAARRTVTLSVLPLAIVGAVIVALLFFSGGIAVGLAVGDHPARTGIFQPFTNGRNGTNGENGAQGGQYGFGQHNGQDNRQRPNDRATTPPKNG
jgi:hypothetical protein